MAKPPFFAPSRGPYVACSVLLLATVACGSSENKRTPQRPGDDGGAEASAGGGGNGSGGAKGSGGAGASGGAKGSGGVTATGGSGQSGSGGASSGGPDAGDGGEPELLGPYVDCQNGAARGDGGTGDQANPFKTIAQAVQYASAGQAVFILDGRCDDSTEPSFGQANGVIDVPDGVSIRAVNPGQVVLAGMPGGFRARALRFLGSGEVIGVRFEDFGSAIQASTGTLRVKGVTFNNVYQDRPLMLTGDVKALVEPDGVTNYIGTNQHGFASLANDAKLAMHGGTLSGATDTGISGDALFTATDNAELVFDGFSATANQLNGIAASGAAKVVVRNNSLFDQVGSNACCNQSVAHLGGTSTLEVLDSRFDRARSNGIVCRGETPTITLRRSSVTNGLGSAILSVPSSNCRPTLTLEDAKVNRNHAGISLNYGGEIRITGSEINDNGNATPCGSGDGLYINDPARAQTLYLRSTSIQRNCGHGVRLNGAAASSFDLGRGSSPGGNTIAGQLTTGYYNLTIDAAPDALTVYAAGNTWNPGIQGAGETGSTNPLPGQYAVVSGNTRDVTGAVTGANHTIRGAAAATTTLRLAENP